MSEEVPQTADGAIRSWFAAAGFTCVLLGGEMIVLHSAISAGIFLLVASAPFYWAAYKWSWLKSKLDVHALQTINSVATDARWWFALFFVALIVISFLPYIEQRWSFADLVLQWPWLVASLVVAVVVGVAVLFSNRRHHPQNASIELQTPSVAALALHTCRIAVQVDAIESDLRLDINITMYNGETIDLSAGRVSGKIRFDNLQKEFPDNPSIICDDPNKLSAPEFTITLRQWMPREFAIEILRLIENGEAVVLILQSLTVPIYKNDQPDVTFRMPIWDGIRIARSVGVVGRILFIGGSLHASGQSRA